MARINISDSYVQCRTLGHSWDQIPTVPFKINGTFGKRGQGGWRMTFRCTVCHTIRHDLINPSTGEVTYRHYEYPEDYQYVKGETPSRGDFRKELYRRSLRKGKAKKAAGGRRLRSVG